MGGITDNLGTIVVASVLVAAVVLVIAKMIRDRKRGRSSCGCGCSSCALKDSCHREEGPKEQRNEK